MLALYLDPRGFCVFSFLSDLSPGVPPHPQLCPTPPLRYLPIYIPDLYVLFQCGHESPLLEPRHEKFFATRNPQQNSTEDPPCAVSCPVVEWIITKVVAPWRKSLLLLYLQGLCLAKLLACSRCSAETCWMSEGKLGAQGKLIGARQPSVESKGDRGHLHKTPDGTGQGCFFPSVRDMQGASTCPCPSADCKRIWLLLEPFFKKIEIYFKSHPIYRFKSYNLMVIYKVCHSQSWATITTVYFQNIFIAPQKKPCTH